jgi:hypothetical protein
VSTPRFLSIELPEEQPVEEVVAGLRSLLAMLKASGKSAGDPAVAKAVIRVLGQGDIARTFETLSNAADAALATDVVQRLARRQSAGDPPDPDVLRNLRLLMSNVTPKDLLEQVETSEAKTLPELLCDHLVSKLTPEERRVAGVFTQHVFAAGAAQAFGATIAEAERSMAKLILGNTGGAQAPLSSLSQSALRSLAQELFDQADPVAKAMAEVMAKLPAPPKLPALPALPPLPDIPALPALPPLPDIPGMPAPADYQVAVKKAVDKVLATTPPKPRPKRAKGKKAGRGGKRR